MLQRAARRSMSLMKTSLPLNAEEFESLRFHIGTSARFWILGLRILECEIANVCHAILLNANEADRADYSGSAFRETITTAITEGSTTPPAGLS